MSKAVKKSQKKPAKAAKPAPKPKKKPAMPAPAKPAASVHEGQEVPKRKASVPQLLRGMKDVLPADQPYWTAVRDKIESLAREFGYRRIDTPVMEETSLFVRGVGRQTDIVEKEMYSFIDQGGEKITLRPEFTAATVRAYLTHGMWNKPQPVKLSYYGPAFRHEKPQRGRYRQLTQGGLEVIGSSHPVLDSQLAFIAYLLFKDFGLDVVVHINSIGDKESREKYKEELVNYYRANRSKICEDCKKRLVKNPLRLLDCKEEGCVAVRAEAPQIVDHLNEASKNHFVRVLEYLDELEVPYQLNPYLVRGLDYYDHTVFEVLPAEEGEQGQQSALAAGGRYDGLVETLGGEPTPACGFSWGVDRVVLKLKEKQVDVPRPPEPDVFLAQLGEPARRKMLSLFERLRAEGVRAAEAFGKDALKQQLEAANRFGARFTLILGQKEVLDGTILIRDMDSGIQEIVDFNKIVPEIKKKLATLPAVKPRRSTEDDDAPAPEAGGKGSTAPVKVEEEEIEK